MLICKNIHSKTKKQSQIPPASIEKNKFLLFKKTLYGSTITIQGITIGKCKTKTVQADLGIFWHDQAYSGIIQEYLGIFRTLVCAWHIKSCGISRLLLYSKSEEYSEPSQKYTMKRFAKIYIHKL